MAKKDPELFRFSCKYLYRNLDFTKIVKGTDEEDAVRALKVKYNVDSVVRITKL